jgi:hypothetical protein
VKPLRADSDAALATAHAALAQAEQRIGELMIARSLKLDAAEDDYISEVGKLDVEIASLRASVAIHSDRAEALKVRQRGQERARREQTRLAGIAEVRKRLTRRHEAARKLDAALKQAAEAFADLEASDIAAFADWPAELPLAHEYFRARTIEPLSTRHTQRMVAGLVRELANRVVIGIAAEVEKRNGELIEELSSAPIGEPGIAA